MLYEVTITRTGGIVVYAESVDEALEKVKEVSNTEIEEHAQLTGWEVSDAELLDDKCDSV